jgi:predicted P-loop ATPase
VFHILGGEWFTDDLADVGSKDSAMQIHSAWIVEMSELTSMSKVDVNKIKSFMVREEDKFRPPYAREVKSFKRTNAFGGTVNDSEYLKDDTGGRRFWPAAVKFVMVEDLTRDRDQLIAEAIHRFKLGEKFWIDEPDLTEIATEEQEQRTSIDMWVTRIDNYVNDPLRMGRIGFMASEILEHCIDKKISDMTDWDKRRVINCLKKLGFTDIRRQKRTGREREYISPTRKALIDGDPVIQGRKDAGVPDPPPA